MHEHTIETGASVMDAGILRDDLRAAAEPQLLDLAIRVARDAEINLNSAAARVAITATNPESLDVLALALAWADEPFELRDFTANQPTLKPVARDPGKLATFLQVLLSGAAERLATASELAAPAAGLRAAFNARLALSGEAPLPTHVGVDNDVYDDPELAEGLVGDSIFSEKTQRVVGTSGGATVSDPWDSPRTRARLCQSELTDAVVALRAVLARHGRHYPGLIARRGQLERLEHDLLEDVHDEITGPAALLDTLSDVTKALAFGFGFEPGLVVELEKHHSRLVFPIVGRICEITGESSASSSQDPDGTRYERVKRARSRRRAVGRAF